MDEQEDLINSQFDLRDESNNQSLGASSPPDSQASGSTNTNVNTNTNKNNTNWGDILDGFAAIISSGANLTNSIGNVANGSAQGTTTNTNQIGQNNNNNTKPKGISPLVIGGGIALVLLLVVLIIYTSNGNNSSKPKS